MRLSKIFNPRVVIIILLLAFLLGIIGSVLISCVERLIYPRNYSEYVTKYAQKYGVPENLVYAVIKTESGFDSNAVSRVGAVGLMQILPSTGEWLAKYHLNDSFTSISLYDPQTNIKYGVYYLQYLFSRFGSWEKAIIAYNWGEGNFSNFLQSNGYDEGEYSSIPVKETRNYVNKVMHHFKKYNKLYK